MSTPKILFGFHAVGVRLKTAPASVIEVYVDPTRRDARMKQFLVRAADAGVRVIEADAARLAKLCGGADPSPFYCPHLHLWPYGVAEKAEGDRRSKRD